MALSRDWEAASDSHPLSIAPSVADFRRALFFRGAMRAVFPVARESFVEAD
jgi:hypothetical protein